MVVSGRDSEGASVDGGLLPGQGMGGGGTGPCGREGGGCFCLAADRGCCRFACNGRTRVQGLIRVVVELHGVMLPRRRLAGLGTHSRMGWGSDTCV